MLAFCFCFFIYRYAFWFFGTNPISCVLPDSGLNIPWGLRVDRWLFLSSQCNSGKFFITLSSQGLLLASSVNMKELYEWNRVNGAIKDKRYAGTSLELTAVLVYCCEVSAAGPVRRWRGTAVIWCQHDIPEGKSGSCLALCSLSLPPQNVKVMFLVSYVLHLILPFGCTQLTCQSSRPPPFLLPTFASAASVGSVSMFDFGIDCVGSAETVWPFVHTQRASGLGFRI